MKYSKEIRGATRISDLFSILYLRTSRNLSRGISDVLNPLLEHYPRYYPLFLTALRTGMQLGELLALKERDLEFDRNYITVRRSFNKGAISTTKNKKIRKVDMSLQLRDILKAHLAKMRKDNIKNNWKSSPEYLFYNSNGKMLDGWNLRRRVFWKSLDKAGLKRIRIHDLRHTYATLRIRKGDNILDVSRQLGHHSAKFTLDVYAHWVPGENKAQVNELDTFPNKKITTIGILVRWPEF